jgi:hypothetical protein
MSDLQVKVRLSLVRPFMVAHELIRPRAGPRARDEARGPARKVEGALPGWGPLVAAAAAGWRRWLVACAAVVAAGAATRVADCHRRDRRGEYEDSEDSRTHASDPAHPCSPSSPSVILDRKRLVFKRCSRVSIDEKAPRRSGTRPTVRPQRSPIRARIALDVIARLNTRNLVAVRIE